MPSPESPIEPLEANTRDLFALFGAPFDGDLDKMNYQANLRWSLRPGATIYGEQSPINIWARVLLGTKLDDDHRDWKADVAFVPQEGQLDFTRITMPLVGIDKSLVLQRVKAGNYFLLLVKNGDNVTELSEPNDVNGTANAIVLSPQFVEQIVAMAGYGLPKIFTNPDDLRLGLAQATDETVKWTITENRVFPETPYTQTTLTRTSTRQHNGKRQDIDTQLQAISEDISPDRTARKQLVVTFNATNYDVKLPSVVERRLRQTDAILGQPGTETYKVTKQAKVRVTPELLARLAEQAVDSFT